MKPAFDFFLKPKLSLVSLLDCVFERLDPDIEHHFPDRPGSAFYKHQITFAFTVEQDTEWLKGIYTRDIQLYDRAVVNQVFPLKRSR